MSKIGMEFKGFHVGSFEEADSVPVVRLLQASVEELSEGDCIEGSEMALDPAIGMGQEDGVGQALHNKGSKRKLLAEISNCPPPEENHSESTIETDALRIAKLGLKRIDPSLQSKRTELEKEDGLMEEEGPHSEADIQIE
nr:hypothetical protein CFP56_47483 [Quercus suber]